MDNFNQYLQQENESFEEWKFRLIFGKLEKTIDLDWSEIVELLDLQCSADHLRKTAYGAYEYYIYSLKKKKNSLEDIRERIGELDIVKRKVQVEKQELGKIKRELIKSISIADDLKQYMQDNNFQVVIPEYCKNELKIVSSDVEYVMIVHITDLHIGYVIDNCKGNYFNWSIANQRIDRLIAECEKTIKTYNINKVYVISTGDDIEHVYMRKNQSQFSEFTLAEQINKAIELKYRFLVALCRHCNVEYDSIYGNHDRMNGEKDANLDGDNSEVIIRKQIGMYARLSGNKRLTVVNRKHNDKEIKKVIGGLKCKFVHGDKIKAKNGKVIIKNEMSMDNIWYDLLFKGHLHNFGIESENHGRHIISTGCLSGYNDYSTNFGCTTVASQTIAVIKQDLIAGSEIELIKDVKLQ